ncbi:MAG: hypothetical protein AUG49_09870 [Catenulispora sp. 13_1_20CM_3_70_7]|nr:MAG: hypothetical protein AUG49_09870 [Catenulispora sp. 13_1_20CM_3_70_7]
MRADRLVFAATGGWAFGARAAAGAAGAGRRLHVADRLDPAALAALPTARGRTAAVAVSESGRTLETRALAEALRDRKRLNPVWLRGDGLSLGDGATTALYGAPLSLPFMLAARMAHGEAIREAYEGFAGLADDIGTWAATVALEVTDLHRTGLHLGRHGGREGLRLFALQALRQGLGGKAVSAYPDLVTGQAQAHFDVVIRIPAVPGLPPLTRTMAALYAVSALTACIGILRGLAFAEHRNVEAYKRLVDSTCPQPIPIDAASLGNLLTTRLSEHEGTRALHAVCYERRWPALYARTVSRTCRELGVPAEFHLGSTWNHHSYQAIHGRSAIQVVAIAPRARPDPLTRLQRRIAAATCASLPDQALLLERHPSRLRNRASRPGPGEREAET